MPMIATNVIDNALPGLAFSALRAWTSPTPTPPGGGYGNKITMPDDVLMGWEVAFSRYAATLPDPRPYAGISHIREGGVFIYPQTIRIEFEFAALSGYNIFTGVSFDPALFDALHTQDGLERHILKPILKETLAILRFHGLVQT